MKFHGIKKVSLIDYPQKISCTLFTNGCNLRCPFCHNPELVQKQSKPLETIDSEQFIEFLKTRKRKLDGVVITGGEPLIHTDKLSEVLLQIKKLGFLVKIDTNGTLPTQLKQLITEELVDFVAMDFKTTPSEYDRMKPQIANASKKVLESLRVIKSANIDYEIRTTIVPTLHNQQNISEVAQTLRGIEKYVLQNFVPKETLDPDFSSIQSFTHKELLKFKDICKKYIKHVEIRDNSE